MARDIMHRLRFDNDTIRVVSRLVLYHDYGNGVDPDMRIVRRAVNRIGEDVFPMTFPVRYADINAQSSYKREEKLQNLAQWKELYQRVRKEKQCVSLKTLAVTGSDLIAHGMKPGKEIGNKLQEMLELVLDNPEYNEKEYLLDKFL